MGNVRWRVRAVRTIYGAVPSGLPRVSYGPWSPVYVSANPTPGTGALSARLGPLRDDAPRARGRGPACTS